MRRGRIIRPWIGVGVVVGATLFGTGCASSTTVNASVDEPSCGGTIAVMAPITSGAAQVGREQVNFAQLAVDDFNAENGSTYSTIEFDTMLSAAEAAKQAQIVSDDAAVVAVVGPSSSQEVAAVGPVFAGAGLAFVSGAATRPDLTDGSNPGFFRVVPHDSLQGVTAVDFIANELGAERVVVLAEQTEYGIGLSAAVEEGLGASGVAVEVIPVLEDETRFDQIVDLVPMETDVVFATFQVGAKTQKVADLLRQGGNQAVMFGSESSFSPDFSMPGSYVTAISPILAGVPGADGVIDRYTSTYGSFGPYGAPTYVAMQAVLDAAQRACMTSGEPADRAGILAELPSTDIPDSILGYAVEFETNGDSKNATFAVLTIDESGAFVNVP